jgi:adenine-specific DNA glycosylase
MATSLMEWYDDLGEKFIWQQQHQAHRGGHQGEWTK